MKNIGCIFDLDGVIVDTATYHYQAWRKLAQELGFDFTEKQNERLKGISRMESLRILLEIGGLTKSESDMNTLAAQKNEWYVEMINQMTPDNLLPGALSFLKELKAAAVPLALGSASKNAGLILEKTALKNIFDVVVDGNMVSSSKPDPEVFLKAAEGLFLEPKFCVVFEDASAGIEAAKNAGMKSIGIGDPENLSLADKVFPGLHAINISNLTAVF